MKRKTRSLVKILIFHPLSAYSTFDISNAPKLRFRMKSKMFLLRKMLKELLNAINIFISLLLILNPLFLLLSFQCLFPILEFFPRVS